jgi:hypothetical protein
MCVAITLEPGTHLTLDEVVKMGNANGDGVGLAWNEDDVVHWFKTIHYNPEYIQYLIKKFDDSFRLVHFRLSTAGGVRTDLCHPFEIGPFANTAQAGHANKVMIHNGHWNRWGEVFKILKEEQLLPDTGPWSDSRLAAFLASFDEDWLETVTGRVATLDGRGNIRLLGDWQQLRPGIKVSNKIWDHDYSYKRSGRDRYWEGWGRTEDEWKAKEEHEKAKRAAEEKAKEEKEKEKEKSAREEKKGAKDKKKEKDEKAKNGVVTEHGVGEVRADPAAQGSGHGGDNRSGIAQRGSLQIEEKWEGNAWRFTSKHANGPAAPWGEVERAKERIKNYDPRPWQNPTSKKWYWIPPASISDSGRVYSIMEVTSDEAGEIMVQVADSADGE